MKEVKNFLKDECCWLLRQILGRDLRIQILALVRVRETDCRIRGKREFRRNECFLFSFCHPLSPPLAFRAVSDRKSNLRFIRRTDWSTCLRVGKSFYGFFSGKTSSTRRTGVHRWWLNSHPRCGMVLRGWYYPSKCEDVCITRTEKISVAFARLDLREYTEENMKETLGITVQSRTCKRILRRWKRIIKYKPKISSRQRE